MAFPSFVNRYAPLITAALLAALSVWLWGYGRQERRLSFGDAGYARAEAARQSRHPEVYYLSGLDAERRMDPLAAAGFYRQTVARNPLHMDAWLRLADAMALSGDVEGARRVTAFSHRASAFHGLAVLFLEKGDSAKALERLELARTAARDIADRHNRYAVRVNIADALAAAGAFDEAVKTAKGIEDPYHRETALYHIAREYTRKKRYPEAVQAADRVKDPYYRASALTEIVEAVAAGEK